MRFWDASALIPLLIDESTSEHAREAFRTDTEISVWWATEVECSSAFARLERDGALAEGAAHQAAEQLAAFRLEWHEIQPSDPLRERATRLVRIHPLRAADAFQLAAATVAADGQPSALPFVTLDDRLAVAADREGFPVVRFDRPPL